MTVVLKHAHRWDVSPPEAVRIQEELRQYVVPAGGLEAVRAVAGLDVGFHGDVARAAVVVYSFPTLELLHEALAERPVEFPYIPGLLSFREAPAALAALEKSTVPWDVLLCDAQGIAHPRRLGLASHLGVLLDRPSVGCAKSRLIGEHGPVGDAAGSQVPLLSGDEVIGAVVRTRQGARPVYVSIGHRIDLASAIELVLACTRGYRLPEPTRRAHLLASGGRG